MILALGRVTASSLCVSLEMRCIRCALRAGSVMRSVWRDGAARTRSLQLHRLASDPAFWNEAPGARAFDLDGTARVRCARALVTAVLHFSKMVWASGLALGAPCPLGENIPRKELYPIDFQCISLAAVRFSSDCLRAPPASTGLGCGPPISAALTRPRAIPLTANALTLHLKWRPQRSPRDMLPSRSRS